MSIETEFRTSTIYLKNLAHAAILDFQENLNIFKNRQITIRQILVTFLDKINKNVEIIGLNFEEREAIKDFMIEFIDRPLFNNIKNHIKLK